MAPLSGTPSAQNRPLAPDPNGLPNRGETRMSTTQQDPFEPLPGWARELGELSVGTTILALRRFNIWRRDLETSCPPLSTVIERGVTAVADNAEPSSAQAAEMLRAVEWVTPDPARDVVTATRRVTEKVPDVLRLAGLVPKPKSPPNPDR